LEERGLDILIVSLRHPTDKAIHPVHEQVRAGRLYLPEYLYQEPLRVWRGWRHARRLAGYRAARRIWLTDLVRDPTPNRIRRLGQALLPAPERPPHTARRHAHVLHTPASVTRYTAMMLGLAWSFSAHAKDIWTTPDWEKREKLADADWAVTCTATGHAHLAGLGLAAEKVALCYHGLAFDRVPPFSRQTRTPGGSAPAPPGGRVSVGRRVGETG